MSDYIVRDGKKLLLAPVLADPVDEGEPEQQLAQSQVQYIGTSPVGLGNPVPVLVMALPDASYVTSSSITVVPVDVNTSVDIVLENPDRLSVSIHNHSDEQLIICCADVEASIDAFTQVLQSHDYYELPVRSEYKGRITAIRPEGSLSFDPVHITEYSKVGI